MSNQINLNWKTNPVEYEDTVHHTDDYVVHGRGFIVNDDIWFDEYSVHLSHTQFWNKVISNEYNYPEYTGSWSAYVEEQDFDERPLYWSTTGSGTLIIQAPCVNLMTDKNWDRLRLFIEEEFNFPRYCGIHFYENPRDRNSHTQSVLQALKENDRDNNDQDRLPDWLDKYRSSSIKENEV